MVTHEISEKGEQQAGIWTPVEAWWRRGAAGFLLAGLLFVTASAISFALGEPSQFLDVLMVVGLLSVLVGVVSLYALQRDVFGIFGRLSSGVAIGGLSIAAIGTTTVVVDPAFGWVAFIGLPLTWLGCLAMGVATVRARVLPRWTGVALAVAFPGAVLLFVLPFMTTPETSFSFYPGAIAPGIIWLALAYVLQSKRTNQAGVADEPEARTG